jgi:hypothetical protein
MNKKRKRTTPWNPIYWKTNFYNSNVSGDDRVDAICPIGSAFFQTIIPNYDLSTDETRDQGYGPALEIIETRPFLKQARTGPVAQKRRLEPKHQTSHKQTSHSKIFERFA